MPLFVTHTHEDHWDKAAAEAIRKDIPIFAQHAEDALLIGKRVSLSAHSLERFGFPGRLPDQDDRSAWLR
jgi:L-ascorbate metabolism protein UlaG (beta-lactamase superfamily)